METEEITIDDLILGRQKFRAIPKTVGELRNGYTKSDIERIDSATSRTVELGKVKGERGSFSKNFFDRGI